MAVDICSSACFPLYFPPWLPPSDMSNSYLLAPIIFSLSDCGHLSREEVSKNDMKDFLSTTRRVNPEMEHLRRSRSVEDHVRKLIDIGFFAAGNILHWRRWIFVELVFIIIHYYPDAQSRSCRASKTFCQLENENMELYLTPYQCLDDMSWQTRLRMTGTV